MSTIHPILSRLALSAAAEALTARAAYYAGPTLGGPAALDALSLAEEARHALADAAARAATPERAVELLENAAASYLRSDAPAEHRAGLVRLAQAATEAARRIREAMAGSAPIEDPTPEAMAERAYPDGAGLHEVTPVELKRALYAQGVRAERERQGGNGRTALDVLGGTRSRALRAELAEARQLAERLDAATTHPDHDTELGEARGRVLGLERALAVLGARP